MRKSFNVPALACLLFVVTLFVGSVLAVPGCHAETSEAGEHVVHGAEVRPILEFAEMVESGDDDGTTEFDHHGQSVHLRPLRSFGIQHAKAHRDQYGYPALYFEIMDTQKEQFRNWTGGLVGHRLAILVDGRVLAIPLVVSALPGEGVVGSDSVSEPWTQQYVSELAAHIRSYSGATK